MTPRNESRPSIWSRRAVTVPACLLLAGLVFFTAPLWVVIALAWDTLAGTARKRPRTRALAFFALYLGCEVAGLLAASLLWIVTLGGRLGGPRRLVTHNRLVRRFNAAVGLLNAGQGDAAVGVFREVAARTEDPSLAARARAHGAEIEAGGGRKRRY